MLCDNAFDRATEGLRPRQRHLQITLRCTPSCTKASNLYVACQRHKQITHCRSLEGLFLRFHTILCPVCMILMTLYTKFSTESNLLHVELCGMNFLPVLVVQTSKSEAEQYLSSSLHTQLEVWNTAIVSFLVQDVSLLICPKFKVSLRLEFKKNELQN